MIIMTLLAIKTVIAIMVVLVIKINIVIVTILAININIYSYYSRFGYQKQN